MSILHTKNYINIDFKIYKFKFENLNDRANLSTYYRTLSAQTIQEKKNTHQSCMKNTKIYILPSKFICIFSEFEPHLDLF